MSARSHPMLRRAVFPGSFDPPTIAHIAIATATLDQCDCDSLTFVISRAALGKEERDDTVEERAIALRRVVDERRFSVHISSSRLIVEIAAGYDVVVMGADKWVQVLDPAWYPDANTHQRAVASLPHVALVPRPPHDLVHLAVRPHTVLELNDTTLGEVSSTAVRLGRAEWAARPDRDRLG